MYLCHVCINQKMLVKVMKDLKILFMCLWDGAAEQAEKRTPLHIMYACVPAFVLNC